MSEPLEVLFIGGPLDGQVRAVPAVRTGVEPNAYGPIDVIAVTKQGPRGRETEIETIAYQTKVNPADDGPTWVAVIREEDSSIDADLREEQSDTHEDDGAHEEPMTVRRQEESEHGEHESDHEE